ncbi:YjdF family protein [Acetobacterium carbinolicum]|uniref:YjdF family protein n=1 Tax=Acetobacterium carbinolicum TaxID=52690 RepID=UPI0039C901C1
MDKVTVKLTVFFDDPFWVGVFESTDDDRLKVAKVTFGSEPKDGEIYDFLLKNYDQLQFSQPITDEKTLEKRINPKRMRRNINRQMATKSIGTKAQQALKEEQENKKMARKAFNRQKTEAERKQQFELRQEKKKKKHRGH